MGLVDSREGDVKADESKEWQFPWECQRYAGSSIFMDSDVVMDHRGHGAWMSGKNSMEYYEEVEARLFDGRKLLFFVARKVRSC